MSTCTLRFDQIQIVNKRSDANHADNDWLIVSWFVGPDHVRTDTVPLYNKDGSLILDTGDTLQPVELSTGCADTDLVSASVVAVNLGSLDYSAQLNAAGEIGKAVSQKITEFYLNVVELSAIRELRPPSRPTPTSCLCAGRLPERRLIPSPGRVPTRRSRAACGS